MTVVDQLAFSKNALNQYVKKIEKLIESEVANEESFYADFRLFIDSAIPSERYSLGQILWKFAYLKIFFLWFFCSLCYRIIKNF